MTERKVTPYEALKTPRKPRGPKERFEALRDEGLRAYVRKQRCLVAVIRTKVDAVLCFGATECAHVKSKGAAGGDWDNLVPLCAGHHTEQHRDGIKSFEYRFGFRLKPAARKITAAYVAERKHGS